MPHSFSRRGALTAIAVTATGAMLPRRTLAQDTSATLISGSDVCQIMPEVTEGPYYLDPDLVRADIREDRSGVPMRLRMQIVDAACAPMEGARVDVWHCDAQGVYSGFGGGDAGQTSAATDTFLRGTQMSDARGIVEFRTIYPGWYRGRTVHVHYKVFLDENTVLTGQIFFPDALSAYLFANVPAYVREGERDTVNSNDGIAAEAGALSHAAITEADADYLAQLIVGVSPEARSVQGGGGRPSGPPPDDTAPRMAPGASSSVTAPAPLVPGEDA